MLISNPSIRFSFKTGGEDITTTSIVASSISMTKQMLNDLHSSSNTCSLQLKEDGSGLIETLINENADVICYLSSGNTHIFTGLLSKDHSWRVSQTGEDVFQIKIEDLGIRLLDNPYATYDGTCIKDTLINLVQEIFARAYISTVNIIWDSSVTTEIKEKVLINKIDSSLTCKDMLDQICYEFGLVYYFNAEGKPVIKKIDITSQPTVTIATTADSSTQFSPDYYLYTEGGSGVDLTRKARQYSQAKVSYSTISDSISVTPLYEVTEKIEVPGGQWWDGATHSENIYEPSLDEYFLANKTYYLYNSGTSAYEEATIYPITDTDPTHEPKVGDLIPSSPVYYEYAGQSSLIDMNDSAKGKDILYVYPSTVNPNTTDTRAVPGYVEKTEVNPSTWTIRRHGNTDKLEILIDNTNGGTSAIYTKFKCAGRIIRKQGTSNIYRSLVGLTSNSKTQYNYEAQWLHEKNDAIALCEVLSNYYLYCDNTYTFYCIDDLDLGQVVRVYENLYSGLDVNMLLTAKQYTGYGTHAGLYKYTAQGVSSFDLTSTTRVEKYEAPDTKPTIANIIVRYALWTQGTDPTQVPQYAWQDTIPQAVAGRYIWTWTQYIYTDGSVKDEYSASYTGDVEYQFTMNLNTNTILTDLRRYESQLLRISFIKTGYTGNIRIRGWYDVRGYEEDMKTPDFDDTISGLERSWSIPYNVQHQYLLIRAELVDTPTVYRQILLKYEDITQKYYYAGEFDIDTSAYFDADGNLIPENYSQISFGPVNQAISDHFGWNTDRIDGDSFFNNHHETGFDDVYIYVWQFDKWVPINFSTFSNSEKSQICAQAQKDVLSSIEPGSVTKSDYGYFNTIIAGMITTDYLGSREIELHDGGFLYAGEVDLDQPAGQRIITGNPGFCFDSMGNGELSNVRITGVSTIEGESSVLGTMTNYDNNGELVFKTIKETNTQTTLSGQMLDGVNNPSGYLWSEFYSAFHTYVSSRMTDRQTYTASGTINGMWDSGYSTIYGKGVTAAQYLATAASSTGTTTRYNCSSGYKYDETRVIYTNSNPYKVKLSQVYIYAKTVQEPTGLIGPLGWGYVHAYVYDANDNRLSTIVDFGAGTGRGGGQYRYAYNVEVPPGGYIKVEWGEGDTWWIQSETNDGYATYTYKESDNFSQGLNLITSDGNIYNTASLFPNTMAYGSYAQVLTISGANIAINMRMQASSTWLCPKYYYFAYTQSPGVASTVTTSIFNVQSFTYDGQTYTVSSITYDNYSLKVATSDGNVFEFGSIITNYYKQYSFYFEAAAESLGAYARTFLPTDDPNTHNIGAAGSYSSGVSQRWDNGFFDLVDANTVNSGWACPIITSNYTITDNIPVGVMRPYFINSSSTISLTMPGDSSQQYIVICHNVIVSALVSAGKVNRYEAVAGGASLSVSWTSSAEPYMLIEVLRLS